MPAPIETPAASEAEANRKPRPNGMTDEQVRYALAAFGRRPDSGEIDSALSYIDSMEKRLGTPDAHLTSWQSFCHILMSANEFLYVN